VSVHAVTDTASCPLDWRLFLPEAWGEEAADDAGRLEVVARRNRCGIPPDERYRPKWALVVEMLDELAEHGLRPQRPGRAEDQLHRAGQKATPSPTSQTRSRWRGCGPGEAAHLPAQTCATPTRRSAWPHTYAPPDA